MFPDSTWKEIAGFPSLSVAFGKIFFEIEVAKANGEVCIGFAGSNCCADYVGGDDASWGVGENGNAYPRHVTYSAENISQRFTVGPYSAMYCVLIAVFYMYRL